MRTRAHTRTAPSLSRARARARTHGGSARPARPLRAARPHPRRHAPPPRAAPRTRVARNVVRRGRVRLHFLLRILRVARVVLGVVTDGGLVLGALGLVALPLHPLDQRRLPRRLAARRQPPRLRLVRVLGTHFIIKLLPIWRAARPRAAALLEVAALGGVAARRLGEHLLLHRRQAVRVLPLRARGAWARQRARGPGGGWVIRLCAVHGLWRPRARAARAAERSARPRACAPRAPPGHPAPSAARPDRTPRTAP